MEAARRIAGGPQDDIGLLAAMGASEEVIRKAAAGPSELEIWPENWPALRVFLAMQTQWRVGMAGPVGLDYGVLRLVERRIGITPRQARRHFVALQVLEGECLRIWSERRNGG